MKKEIASLARRSRISVASLTEEHAERAAIREYLGGMPRAEAEKAALADTCDVFGIPEDLRHG
jgi:hypothetical protein